MPALPSIAWTPASCFLTFQATLACLFALMFLWGPPEEYYKSSPHIKELMNRQSELSLGGLLLGMACGVMAAVIAGGAQDMCILQLVPVAVCNYVHYTGIG